MAQIKQLGFQAKITAGIAAIVFLFGCALAVLVGRVATQTLLERITQKGAEDARDLAQKMVDPVLAGDYLRLRNIADEVKAGSSEVSYVFILDKAGNVLVHTFANGFPLDLAKVNEPGVHASMMLIDSGEGLIYDFASRAEVDGLNLGTARVGISYEKATEVIGRLSTSVMAATALAMIVAGGLGALFSRTITRRINILRAGAEAIVRGLAVPRTRVKEETPCHAVIACGNTDCPSYNDHTTRCWLSAGQRCKREGRDPLILDECRHCPVYEQYRGDEISALTDAFDVMAKTVREREDERDRALSALRESEQRWEFALEGSGEGVWDWNVATGEIYFSPKWKAMLGYGDDEIAGNFNEWRSRLHPDDAVRSMHAVEAHLRGDTENLNLEHRLRGKDGDYKWILSSGKVIRRDSEGKPLRMIGTHTDITQRVQMQEVMVQTEKMLSIGGLAAGMAHEINNPLGGILQGVQNILRRLSPDLPANVEAAAQAGCELHHVNSYLDARQILRFLDGIRESGQRAAHIVANMLEFSRRSTSRLAPTDLGTICDKALELARSDYDLKKFHDFRGILVRKDYDRELGPVPCASTQIEQVVFNLLKNAAQAMSAAGTMDPAIDVRVARDGDMARIEIADNGPGIDEDTRKRIFEPFFTTKEPGVGTGLGLSVSYFIVTQNHAGTFTVASQPGKGTIFTVRLPMAGPSGLAGD